MGISPIRSYHQNGGFLAEQVQTRADAASGLAVEALVLELLAEMSRTASARTEPLDPPWLGEACEMPFDLLFPREGRLRHGVAQARRRSRMRGLTAAPNCASSSGLNSLPLSMAFCTVSMMETRFLWFQ